MVANWRSFPGMRLARSKPVSMAGPGPGGSRCASSGSAPIGAHFLFPVPLTADVIDHDSGRTNLRREATYLGASTFVERMATSFAPPLLVLLRLLGDTPGRTLGVRLVAPVGGLIVLAGWLLFRAYDIPDEVRIRIPPEPAVVAESPVAAPISPTASGPAA